MVVRARYSDGTDRDVTRFTVFVSNNDAAVAVDEHGLATGKGPGEAFILTRFDKFTSGVPIIVRPGTPSHWPAIPATNYIDTLVYAKLDRLNIVPSEVCSDETFLRRAYIDLIGLLPTSEEHHEVPGRDEPQEAVGADRQSACPERIPRHLGDAVGRTAADPHREWPEPQGSAAV